MMQFGLLSPNGEGAGVRRCKITRYPLVKEYFPKKSILAMYQDSMPTCAAISLPSRATSLLLQGCALQPHIIKPPAFVSQRLRDCILQATRLKGRGSSLILNEKQIALGVKTKCSYNLANRCMRDPHVQWCESLSPSPTGGGAGYSIAP